MNQSVRLDGELLDAAIEHLSWSFRQIENMADLGQLKRLHHLRSASFCATNLDDEGLAHVSQIATLENLNLQETRISNPGLATLEQLPKLRYLRLKGNPQLSDACVRHLARLSGLVDLQVQETSLTANGLRGLITLPHLRDLCVDAKDGDDAFAEWRALSAHLPACRILAKGRGEFFQGAFNGTW